MKYYRSILLTSALVLGIAVASGVLMANNEGELEPNAVDPAVIENVEPSQMSVVSLDELPVADAISFAAQDVVMQADFDAHYLAKMDRDDAYDAGALPLHPSDIFDLNQYMMSQINERFDDARIKSMAAYLYQARLDGFEHRLSLSEDEQQAVIEQIEAAGYDASIIQFEQFDELINEYTSVRAERVALKSEVLNNLYDAMDVLDFIAFDQKGRICDQEGEAEQDRCLSSKAALLDHLDKEATQAQCRSVALSFMGRNLSLGDARYSASYHNVVDHKQMKFIIEAEDYDRDELREYMDGALKKLHEAGFDPADKAALKVAQSVRAQVIKLCVGLMINDTFVDGNIEE